MSIIFFTEGKNDVDFLTHIHRNNVGENFDTYIDQETDGTQDTRIRQHLLDNSIPYLYKGEGGKSEVIKKFRSQTPDFGDYELTLFVDFDGEGKDAFQDLLNKKLDEHYHGGLRANIVELERYSVFAEYRLVIEVRGDKHKAVDLFAFYESLEDIVGIDDSDSRPMKKRKIRRYIEANPGVERDVSEQIF